MGGGERSTVFARGEAENLLLARYLFIRPSAGFQVVCMSGSSELILIYRFSFVFFFSFVNTVLMQKFAMLPYVARGCCFSFCRSHAAHTTITTKPPQCSGRAARDGPLSARCAAWAENPIPVAHPAQRGSAANVQHTLLWEGTWWLATLFSVRWGPVPRSMGARCNSCRRSVGVGTLHPLTARVDDPGITIISQ